MPHSPAPSSPPSSSASAPPPQDIHFGALPPSIHSLVSIHPATHQILLPKALRDSLRAHFDLPESATHLLVNGRYTKLLPESLPSPPLPLLSPTCTPAAGSLLLAPADSRRCRRVVVAPLLPPAPPPSAARLLASLARRALLGRDARREDLVPVAPGVWVLVKDADEGVVTKATTVEVRLGANFGVGVPERLKEWVLHAWHQPTPWARDVRRRLLKATEDGRGRARGGVVGVTGCLQDVLKVVREFSVGRYVISVHDDGSGAQRRGETGEHSVVDAFARAELYGGVLVVPAGGKTEAEAMRLITRPRDGDYLLDGTAECGGVRVIVMGEELGPAAKEARAVVEIPRADASERMEFLEAVAKDAGDEGDGGKAEEDIAEELLELVRMSAGFAREHVQGLAMIYADRGLAGCRKAAEFFGSTLAVNTGNVGWDDIGGLEEAKEQIMELVDLHALPGSSEDETGVLKGALNRRVGVLLYGPPGTGKTLLARAVATEARCSFISVKGPELFDMYVGESEKNVREVFRRATEAAPCIVFFDEVDALAPSRGRGSDSGGVADRVVSQLLGELDEIAVAGDVFVIAASNRPDLVDPGLLRPGRLDKVVYVPMPATREDQAVILQAQTRRFVWEGDVDFSEALQHAPAAPTLSGADLYGLASRAWMNAAKRVVQVDGDGEKDIGQEENDTCGTEVRAAQEWAANIDRIYGDWFREDRDYEREYPVDALLSRDRKAGESVVRVSQQDLVEAAMGLTPSLTTAQLQEYEELRIRMEGR